MLDEIYNQRILKLAADIPRIGQLDTPDGKATAVSKLCGSKVSVEVKMEGGIVTDFAHDVKACALGQASSSILAAHVVGSTSVELYELRDAMRAMLKEGGDPPGGKWVDTEVLTPVRDYKARHASTLLTFEATCDAVDEAMGGAPVAD